MTKPKQHFVRTDLATFYDREVSVTQVLEVLKDRGVLVENAVLEVDRNDPDDRDVILFERRPENEAEKAKRLALVARKRAHAKKSAERRKAAIVQREKKQLARLLKKHGDPTCK